MDGAGAGALVFTLGSNGTASGFNTGGPLGDGGGVG